MITELENTLQSFTDLQRLADLYIIKDVQKSRSNSIVDTSNITLQELNDILPQFRNYCMIKKRYQLNELPKQTVVYAMKDVCKELNEFVHILYSNTDMQEEREEIKNLIANLADIC
jgi:hypothetical protein